MATYQIEGVTVVEIKPVSGGNESLCECPSCGNPKLYVNKSNGTYHCKTCPLSGRVNGFGNSSAYVQPPKQEQPKIDVDRDTIHGYIKILVGTLENNEFVRSFFHERRLNLDLAELHEIGYSRLTPPYPDKDIAEFLGLLNKKHHNRFYKRLVFPVKNDGQYQYITSRAIGIRSDAKFVDMKAPHGKPLINRDVIKDHDTIFICEGYPDVLAMESNKHPNTIGILGVTLFKQDCADDLKGKKVILATDNDEAGKVNAVGIASILEASDIEVLGAVDLPEGYDVGDYFKVGKTQLELIPISEIKIKEGELSFKTADSVTTIYGFGKYDIKITDIDPRRGSLRATIAFSRGGKLLTTSSINLKSVRSRSTYAKEIAQALDIETKKAKQILINLCSAVQTKLEESKDEELAPQAYIMSEKERSEAIKFLKSPGLMHSIKIALDRQEIVGEDINKLLMYLIMTSRIQSKPISCIVKGPSSSGKTYLMQQVLTLIPAEGKVTLQEATAKSLFYVGENDLSHKVVVIGEMKGGESSEYAIREAQDGIGSGDLEIWTVEKNPDSNRMETVTRRVKGPCGFITSTTEVSIHAENETRNFSIYVQADEQKVRDTRRVEIDKYMLASNRLNNDELILFHNAQRCLETAMTVKIPYIGFVLNKFPSKPIRVMRDRKRFCVLIETIAILHQYQRQMHVDKDSGAKWIEATIADYYTARSLLNEILVETIHELPPRSKEIYDKVIEMRKEFSEVDDGSIMTPEEKMAQFHTTYKKIAEHTMFKNDDIRRWSAPLFTSGHFDYYDTEGDSGKGGRGKETKLIPIDKEFYEGFLPSPEEVALEMGVLKEVIIDPITGKEESINLEIEL